jgi:hypothetical protein
MTEVPDELRQLHEKLGAIRFRSAGSLEPELLGRLRRGDQPQTAEFISWRRYAATAAATLLTAGAALVFAGFIPMPGRAVVTVDRCCYDLDGGGPADDGVLVLAQRDSKVHRLRVYEDGDGSRSFTPGDLVRLDRGEKPAILSAGGEGVVTTERCCLDFDGGGPDDDGLLVIGVPPNRVLMAAIYETGAAAGETVPKDGWLLR